jgi:DNA primase
LGEKAGIEISRLSQREQREFDILYEIHKTATEFYRNNLKNNKEALNYLKERGLNDETIEEFDLGFASQGDELTKYLLKSGYDIQHIIKTGLTQKTQSGLFKDKFQNRIIFPITNHINKVVAFTGRIMPQKDGIDPPNIPKYLNSPETLIFNKSKILYGLGKTKQYISEKKEVIIVEGQMDLLMMWQTGFKNVVAVSGTGLTEEHLLRLRRIADKVVLSFDKDKAGIKALERSLNYFYKFDFYVKVLDLKNYKDPALACKENKELVFREVENAKPALLYLMDIYIKEDFSQKDILMRKKIIRHFLKLINSLESALEKGEWIKILSSKTGISENDLREELKNLGENIVLEESANYDIQAEDEEDKYYNLLKRLYILSLTEETFSNIIKGELSYLPWDKEDFWKNKLNIDKNVLELEAEYLKNSVEKKLILKEFKDLLKRIKIVHLRKEVKDLKRDIQKAEKEGNEEVLKELLQKFYEKRKEINEIEKSIY